MTDPVEQAAAALADNPTQASRLAQALVMQNAADPRPRLILASALRRLGKPSEALPLLVALAAQWPRAARTRYELGLSLSLLGREEEGIAHLEAAVAIEPGLVEAWEALSNTAFALGRYATEAQAQARLARLSIADLRLAAAAEAVALGRCEDAEPVLRDYLASHPDHVEALRLLSDCLSVAGAHEQAEALLRHALTIQPELAPLRFALARALFAAQRAEAALLELAPLERADPANPAYRNLRGACLALLGDEAGAAAIQGELAARYPANPRIAVNLGHAWRTRGDRDGAIAAYRRAAALQPTNGEAWWSLANLKIGVLGDADESEMRRILQRPDLDERDRMRLSYALGRLLEDAGRFAESFKHYAAGAAFALRQRQAPAPDYGQLAAEIGVLFSEDFFALRSGWGARSTAPIFVVGLPRSGSTLVEQILATHPDIEGTMELPYMGSIAGRLAATGPDAVSRLTEPEVRALGEEYLAQAEIHRRLGRPHFIDKMPNNFRHVRLIRLILPNARIIDVRRHPMAAGFSCFKQLFAKGHDYSYDLAEVGMYYRFYLFAMQHFARVQPGKIYTQVYEDLVAEPETQIAALLDAAGVDFAPECLRFHENRRAVRTVSSEQVRQPIYRSALEHWRHYEAFLGPLEQALGDAGSNWH
ncbi:tetratricopeptide repeat-containing sulfotransferase family protein [Novosphingobium sp. SG707]|uniref:tetratricopeptide repeat-containing sulfotransferase family protein n=1 Tax=Novosphingobium sp. SG707 TaxID=2586996 RepID=UPI001445F66A|nr:tetratricopeptide repeat-containing sulfotransferase family protein [Novosphingobium sp. SG707]NKJ01562.1 tetratricopeptide (TPR) repeat protein [Novosphingobium sp. SG707]